MQTFLTQAQIRSCEFNHCPNNTTALHLPGRLFAVHLSVHPSTLVTPIHVSRHVAPNFSLQNLISEGLTLFNLPYILICILLFPLFLTH